MEQRLGLSSQALVGVFIGTFVAGFLFSAMVNVAVKRAKMWMTPERHLTGGDNDDNDNDGRLIEKKYGEDDDEEKIDFSLAYSSVHFSSNTSARSKQITSI